LGRWLRHLVALTPIGRFVIRVNPCPSVVGKRCLSASLRLARPRAHQKSGEKATNHDKSRHPSVENLKFGHLWSSPGGGTADEKALTGKNQSMCSVKIYGLQVGTVRYAALKELYLSKSDFGKETVKF
jgi:hypothetical protein